MSGRMALRLEIDELNDPMAKGLVVDGLEVSTRCEKGDVVLVLTGPAAQVQKALTGLQLLSQSAQLTIPQFIEAMKEAKT